MQSFRQGLKQDCPEPRQINLTRTFLKYLRRMVMQTRMEAQQSEPELRELKVVSLNTALQFKSHRLQM